MGLASGVRTELEHRKGFHGAQQRDSSTGHDASRPTSCPEAEGGGLLPPPPSLPLPRSLQGFPGHRHCCTEILHMQSASSQCVFTVTHQVLLNR